MTDLEKLIELKKAVQAAYDNYNSYSLANIPDDATERAKRSIAFELAGRKYGKLVEEYDAAFNALADTVGG